MTDQSHSPFHKALSVFVYKSRLDEEVLRIFEVFLQQANPMTLDELADLVFDTEVPDDEYFILEWEEKYDKKYCDTHICEGIEKLRALAIPILKSEDGKYRLGNSVGDIWEMISSLEDEIKSLNGALNTIHMNFGRQLEANLDEEC